MRRGFMPGRLRCGEATCRCDGDVSLALHRHATALVFRLDHSTFSSPHREELEAFLNPERGRYATSNLARSTSRIRRRSARSENRKTDRRDHPRYFYSNLRI